MSVFDPIAHVYSEREKVDFIVPERIREACAVRGISYGEAAEICGIHPGEFGLYANNHKKVPSNLIFGLMKATDFPKDFFYYVQWERV